MIRSKHWLVGAASVVAGVGALGAEAAQLCVNPGGTGGCFATVQAAVIAASAGDIIVVAAGTYAEHVTVNKTLTLNGANANVNACTGGRGPESTVSNAKTAFNITANNVTLNGFTVRDNTDPNVFGSGVLLGAGTSGAQVLNNIITNNIVGIQLGSSNSLIQGNAINSNNQPGPISGTGIYSDQFVAGGILQNPQIIGNCFDNDSNAGVTRASSDLTKPSTNLAISNNVFTNDGNAVAVSAATNATISGNTAHGSSGSQIVLFGGTNGVSVTSNAVLGGAGRGIHLLDAIGGAPNVNVTVSLNRIVGNPTAGLGIDAGGVHGDRAGPE